jgi:beta-xylosidase
MYKSAGSYDFGPLDTYLSAISLANMRPIMELDFFPSGISSQRAPISDYTNWKAYVSAVAKHCVDKFGADDVGKWYWEVWNEPDYDGFWKGTDMNAYYTLYDNTVDALTSVMPNILVGGPATSMNGPIKAFLQHCKSAGKRVTFASSHVYPGGANTGTSASASNLVSDNDARISGITGAGYTTTDVKSFNTEWNSSYNGQGGLTGDVVTSMDNHWNVGFILKGVKLLSDKNSGDTPPIEVFSYWALSDVFDESSGTESSYMLSHSGQPFGQVFGLITVQGMRKAAFNAFKLLNYLGPNRLKSSGGTGSDGIDAMATSSAAGDSLEILVYNYYAKVNTASGSGDSVTINVSNLPSALANQSVFVTQFLVDETHSNPYSVWQSKASSCTSCSETQWQQMRAAQHLALVGKVGDKQSVTTSFTTTFSLAKQAGTLIILSTKRPVCGRDATVEIEGEDYDGQSGASKKDSGDSTTLGQMVSLGSGGYVYFENVDYGDAGVSSVSLRAKAGSDTTLELHQDTQTGTLLAKCPVSGSSWSTSSCALSQGVSGVSKLYVVAGGAVDLNWLKFGGNAPPPTGGAGGGSGGAGGSAPGGAGGSAPGGAGGSVAGGAGGSARGGAGGSAGGGAGGTTTGPSTGTARGGAGGTTTGPTTGTVRGGAGGSAAGGAGGNVAGAAGGSANGGAGGNANGGAGGSVSGGAGSGGGNGDGGSAGNANGGAGSGGSASGSGGSGGASGSGGSSPPAENAASGCACRMGKASGPSGSLLLVGLVAAVIGLRRHRARHRR